MRYKGYLSDVSPFSPEPRLAASLVPPPEAGQLVTVRRRQWVVKDVARSTLEPDPLRTDTRGPQHLVKLTSVEEDGLGDELQVIWEIEAGARVFENENLPDPRNGFDDPRHADAFLDAVLWGAVASADVRALQAPFRSGITIEDYQLDPVVRALQMPRVNLLVADDVGLGKTIEAGLVAQELVLRQRVRSILIVVPASLQIKWRDEMREKFGMEFRIIDTAYMRELRRRRGIHVNPWTHYRYLITSIDWIKREKPLRMLRDCLPAPGEPVYPRKFDLLICDEAHNFAPSGSGKYAVDSQRTNAIRTLAPHFEHKLFLSATPHNGYPESFSALLELLDDQRFARAVQPDPKQLDAVMVRRLKSEMKNFDGEPVFPPRIIEPIEVAWSSAERGAWAKLQEYGKLRQSGDQDSSGRMATEFVLKMLKKRMFSSPAAFARTLEKHRKTLHGIKETKRTRRRPAPGILRRQLERVDEERADDENWEVGNEEAVDTATALFDDLSEREKKLLRELEDWAEQAKARPDSKCKRLVQWLEETLRPDGQWNDERVIIFTEYRATQMWLETRLSTEGFTSNDRLETIYGGMDPDDRERIKAAFQEDPRKSPVRILLATDAASEGIDLQNWCHRIIHWEIPWNPNRLEQRNGRVDRHGQRKNPRIYHFAGEGWNKDRTDFMGRGKDLEADLEFLWVAAHKVDRIREDLGGKVGPVLATQVEEAMLGRRTRLDTSGAEKESEAVRRMFKFERDLKARIGELHDRLAQSRKDLDISPVTVRRVVETALALAGKPPLEEAELEGVWPDSAGKRSESPVFRMPRLAGSWSKCQVGLEHPYTGEPRPITFDHDVAAATDDVVLIHLNHPLAEMCQSLLRREVWASEGRLIHRVSVRVVPDEAVDEPIVVAHARLLVLGALDQRLHEEIIMAGGRLREGRFARLNVGQTKAAWDAATEEDAPENVKDRFKKLWPKIEDAVRQSLTARASDLTNGLQKRLEEKAESEVRQITAVLDELERTIREELETPPPEQLDFWKSEEQQQFERNADALRARLASLPAERDREVAAIRERYSSPEPRHFPVAITFLVPAKLAR